MSPLAPPNQPITFVPAHAGDIIRIGHDLTPRVIEDGSHTDKRLGVAELILAPHTTGPPAPWHEMHDERDIPRHERNGADFQRGGKDFQGKMLADAHGKEAGTRAPHIFANPSGEEAQFINTFTPAFYVNYLFQADGGVGAGPLTPEINMQAVSSYATIPVEKRE